MTYYICKLSQDVKKILREYDVKAPYNTIRIQCGHCKENKCNYEGRCRFKKEGLGN
jgi:hypothetical protein